MKNLNSYLEFLKENQDLPLNLNKFAKMIDLTCIKPDTTKENVNNAIEMCKSNHFYGIVVNPEFTDYLSYNLDGTDIKTITTLDFPDGDSSDVDKISMAIEAISDGTDEIDMVMYYKGIQESHTKDDEETKKSMLDAVEKDIRNIANECHKNARVLKVIIESGVLTLEELVTACQIATNAGADYIQTSTGTKEIGAELSKVREIKRIIPDYVKIKVCGGLKTLDDLNMYYPYADRYGISVIPR